MLVKFTITISGRYKYNRAPNGTGLYFAEAGASRDWDIRFRMEI
jgi:hypothetical protein